MRVISASCNQNHPRFGHRAGLQCVSNTFLYLHTAYLNGAKNVCKEDILDKILEEGKKLDDITAKNVQTLTLSKEAANLRFPSEVPKVIASFFGKTIHALSTPFNGTLETQIIEKETFFGIFDFLVYARAKKNPVHIMITSGVISRGLIIAFGTYYLFDPHASPLSDNASVTICDDLKELVEILVQQTSFYYEAFIIYFVRTDETNLSDDAIRELILKQHNDPDIEFEEPIPITRPLKRNISEHNSAESQDFNEKKHKGVEIPSLIYNDSFPSIVKFGNAINELTIGHKNIYHEGKEWTIYHLNKSFEHEFLWDRVLHLFCQCVDAFLTFKTTNEEEELFVPEKDINVLYITYFSPFRNFSPSFDVAITACHASQLNIVRLHNDYLRNLRKFTRVDKILMCKILKVFHHYSEKHGNIVNDWLNDIIERVPNNHFFDLQSIAQIFTEHPIYSSEGFICLSKEDKHKIGSKISKKRNSIEKLINGIKTIEKLYTNTIDMIGDPYPVDSDLVTQCKKLSSYEELPENLKVKIDEYANSKIKKFLGETIIQINKLIDGKYNNIVAGNMPTDQIDEKLSLLKTTSQGITLIIGSGVHISEDLVKKHQKMQDNLNFLKTGQAVYSNENIDDNIKNLKDAHDASKSEHSEVKKGDILSNIKSTMEGGVQSESTRQMLKEQLSEIKDMSIDDPEISKTVTQLYESEEDEKLLRIMVQNLSYHNMPTDIKQVSIIILQKLLASDPKLRTTLIERLQEILSLMMNDMINKIEIKDQHVIQVIHFIELLPHDPQRTEFLNAVILFRQLVKKYKTVKTFQDLRDMLHYIISNSDRFEKMSRLQFGKDFVAFYNMLKHNFEIQLMEERERSWLDQLKKTTISSPEILSKLIASAPNAEILAKYKDELDRQLQDNMQAVQKKIEVEMKEKEAILKLQLINILNKIISLLKNKQYSQLNESDISTLEALYNTTKDQDSTAKFNTDMRDIILTTNVDLDKLQEKIIEYILNNQTINATDFEQELSPYSANTLIPFLNNLSGTNICYQETCNHLKCFVANIQLTCDLKNKQNKTEVLMSSKYANDVKSYKKLSTYISDLTTHTSEKLNAEFRSKLKTLEDLLPPIDAEKYLLTHVELDLRDKISEGFTAAVFKTCAQQLVTTHNTLIKNHVNELNAQVKLAADHKQNMLSSFKMRWSDFVTNMFMTVPDETANKQKFIEDPIRCIVEMGKRAVEKSPYAKAHKTLQWMGYFLTSAIHLCNDSVDLYGEKAIHFNHRSLKQLYNETTIHQSTMEEKITLNTIAEQTSDMLKLNNILKGLEPNRVVGGEERYKQLSNKIDNFRDDMMKAEQKEQLCNIYFHLVNSVRTYKYGFDFKTQIQKIKTLKYRCKEFSKGEAFNKFPHESDIVTTKEVNIEDYIKGLDVLENYVIMSETFMNSLMGKSLLKNENIPMDLSSKDDSPLDDFKTKLQMSDDTTWYQVTSIFGGTDIYNLSGKPLMFENSYVNCVFKYFCINHKKLAIRKNNLIISAKHQLTTVACTIASVVINMWTDIDSIDLMPFIQGKNIQVDKNVAPMYNLKIFSYVIGVVWSNIQVARKPETTLQLSLEKLTIFMITCYPEFIFNCVSHSIDVSVTSLIQHISEEAVRKHLNVYRNPPYTPFEHMKGYCIDLLSWTETNCKKLLWENEFFRDLCGNHGKFFIYLLATLMLPNKILNLLWNQFKPANAKFGTYRQYIQSLCKDFVERNNIEFGNVTPNEPTHLKNGYRIESKINLRRNKSLQKSELITFLENDCVLDYLLFSYIMNVELTSAIYVDELARDRLLVLRSIENVTGNIDFENIKFSRTVALDHIIRDTWTGNIIEHSCFRVQLNKIIAYVQNNDISLQNTPLIVYRLSSNRVHKVLTPPHTPPKKETTLALLNPFNHITQKTNKQLKFITFPENTEFLFEQPLRNVAPDVKTLAPPPPHTTPRGKPRKTVRFKDEVDVHYTSAESSLTLESLNEPITQRQTPRRGTISKEETLSFTPTTIVHGKKPEQTDIEKTLTMIRTSKESIDRFKDDIDDAIENMTKLYFS
ncbi:large tegument protein [Suid betaherpesvirus 2]|uniref:Large tegument protein n=1 Tax=Suid betaherpesvirus 2 TaxID=1608255 RepID=U3GQ10_9BETA|nr:large tegument protein [Suid betaherpesvirus 2]AGT99225.1 large tegument protein [Suid betaherpesvirus 2]